jgi:hypothetical protein
MGCGGHLRGNVYGASNLCPECEKRREAGEMDAFGRLTPDAAAEYADSLEQLTEVETKELPNGRFQVAA